MASQRNLAILLGHEDGRGSRDLVASEAWFRRASVSGDSHAQWMLGQMLYERQHNRTERDEFEEAFRWFERSAAAGNSDGAMRLGVMYEYGLGVPTDFVAALNAYRVASESNHMDATYNMALMYVHGRRDVIKRDHGQARLHFKRCADAGHPGCMYYMGRLYLEGEITDTKHFSVDYQMAQHYLLSAISRDTDGQTEITRKAKALLSQIQVIVDRTNRRVISIQKELQSRGQAPSRGTSPDPTEL